MTGQVSRLEHALRARGIVFLYKNYHNREDFLDTDEYRQTQIKKKS